MEKESLKRRVINKLKAKQKRIREGKVNCIPSPYKRFSREWCGVEQDCFYLITSFTKGAKTQFTSFTIMYNSLLYAYKHPEKGLDITIIYFPLEETDERIMERFMSYLLYEYSGDRISPRELRSTQEAVDDKAIEFLESDEIDKIIDYFEAHIIFSTESNPTGIMKECVSYASAHGKVIMDDYYVEDDFGNKVKKQRFGKYIPDNPDAYVIPIIDTINFIDTERSMKMKESMDKMSEYCAKIMRNRYKMSPVIIQQQAFEQEKVDEFKMNSNNLRPTVAGLGDSKYSSRDANVALGLFSPARFGIKKFMGYNIEILGDSVRFLEVLTNRDGEMGGMIALYFDGACCYFKELPPALVKVNDKWQETEEIKQFYNWFQQRDVPIIPKETTKEKVNHSFFVHTIINLFNH